MTQALASPSAAAAAAVVLKDHSAAAIGLFNNMRTPAALIGGSLVPLGILSVPSVQPDDTPTVALLKRAHVILGVTSLLSQVLAVTYSSIAINKLAEVEAPLTTGCAELIAQNYELAWIGTNVHFLLGLLGFGLIVGSRAYISNNNNGSSSDGRQQRLLGRVTIGWAVAAFLQALTIVNRGIAMGHKSSSSSSAAAGRFASNFGTLIARYLVLVYREAARGGVLAVGALVVAVFALWETIRVLFLSRKED